MATKTTKKKRGRPAAGAAVPLADRVAKSRAALEERGGAKIPSGWLQPEPARALKYLHTHGYQPTRVGCLSLALIEAAERERKSRKKT